jgi:CRISPR-associated protein Cas2
MAACWLVTYDISDDDRRRGVAERCEHMGHRVQQSVFLCTVSEHRIDRLVRSLRGVLNPATDHVMIVPLCARCQAGEEHHGIPPDDLADTDGPMVI